MALTIENPRVERLVSPRGLLVPDPEFTWTLASSERDQRQTAFEIEVIEIAASGARRPAWQSGKTNALIGDEVLYCGEALTSRGVYEWRVRVWDRDDAPGEWSAWAGFEMGVIAPDRIDAAWIGGGGALRGVFEIDGEIARARAYVSGLGYYEFYCNGTQVSAGTLAPSFTDFETRIEYEIIDLQNLSQGLNAVGFLLGDGWWRHWNQKSLQAIAEIVIDFSDGRRQRFCTGPEWRASPGPVVQSPAEKNQQIFDGIVYDARLIARDWCRPGDDDSWGAVTFPNEKRGELVPSLLPPVRQTGTLAAVSVTRLSDARLIIDFGQNFTGWVSSRAKGSAGTTLVFRHAELLHEDGTVNQNNLRGAKSTDTFILGGDVEEEILEPHFTYHGFRYVQVDGPIECLDPGSITGCMVHSDLVSTADFSSSDEQLNWLMSACRWTARSNLYSVPTDCCQRSERRGWMMDGCLAMNAHAYFFEMEAFCRKWFEDIASLQQEDGSLNSDAAPRFFGKSLGWQRAVVLVPMKIWRQYGDRRFLARAYPAMRRYAEYLRGRMGDGLLENESVHSAEWLSVGHKLKDLPDNALACDIFQQVAEAATVLDHPGDQKIFADAARVVAERFHQKWYGGVSLYGANTEIVDNGCYEGGTFFAQSNQVYPLRFGMVPKQNQQLVFDRLVGDLVGARGDEPFPTTGIGSTVHLLEVLCDRGRMDLAWRIIQRTDYPGWGFMRRHGATTIWERWEFMTYFEMNAHNHSALIGVAGWVFQYIAGLTIVPGGEPVFQLRPAVDLPIRNLDVTWRSRWGAVRVRWDEGAAGKDMQIEIPPGCRAELCLPGVEEILPLCSGRHQMHVETPVKN